MDPLFSLFAQAKTDKTGELIDRLARTPQSQIVIIAAVLTAVRLAAFLYARRTPAYQRTGFQWGVLNFVGEACDAVVYAAIFVFLLIRPYAVQAFKIPSGSMVSTILVQDFIVANKWTYRFSDPKVGDIVVFRPPMDAITDPETQLDHDGEINVDFIKRCIGVPGDLIEFKAGVLYRNGQKVDEPYVHYTKITDFVRELYREDTKEEFESDIKPDFKFVNYKGTIWPVVIAGDYVNTLPGKSAERFLPKSPEEAEVLKKLPAVPIPKGYYLMCGDNRNYSYDGRYWGLVPREEIVGKGEFIWFPLSRMGPFHSGPKNPGESLAN